MIHIDFDPEKLSPELKAEWDALQEKVKDETEALIKKWETTRKLTQEDLNDKIWREMNTWLKKHVFNGKCAYCETHLEGARQTGDAEHYRPKLKVNYKAAPPKKTYITPQAEQELGEKVNHPGYFWLAYHWKNLLPSCKLCNAVQGKKNQFPAQNYVLARRLDANELAQLRDKPYASPARPDMHYLMPNDLDAIENPFLLHPYRDHPEKHLVFGEFGDVTAYPGENPAKGDNSIAVYNLKAPSLMTSRQAAQHEAKVTFDIAVSYFTRFLGLSYDDARKKAAEEAKIQDILTGRSPYSAAQVAYLRLTHTLP